ncbi:MAG: hypothetical protein AAGF12_37370 [Myxococcota bacterium]
MGVHIERNTQSCPSGSEDEGATFEDGGRGYVCRSGQGVPDAVTTLQVRADAGDPNAQELLDCIGESSTVRWVSLGSRPLCLWENSEGAACVGAREAGLRCPVFKDTFQSCQAQLVPAMAAATAAVGGTLTAFEVDDNLGVFADTIHAEDATTTNPPGGPEAERDTAGPPCSKLRTLRAANSSQQQREDARAELLNDPWMSKIGITREAEQLEWEVLPYDYSILSRNGQPWAWTGNPLRDSIPTGQWPCGSPIDGNLASGATPLEECVGDPGFGTAMAGPLGCSFTNDCSVVGGAPGFLDRVRMNQRMGRAALALRLITASGLEGMRLPVNVVRIDDDTVDAFFMQGSLTDTTFGLPTGYRDGAGLLLPGGVFNGIVSTEVRSLDRTGRDESTTVEGSGYCVDVTGGTPACVNDEGGCSQANMGYLHTYLNDDAFYGNATCSSNCLTNNDSSCNSDGCFRVFSPCVVGGLEAGQNKRRAPFLAAQFGREEARPPANALQWLITNFWPGVGAEGPRDVSQSIIRETFDHFVANGASSEVIPRFDEAAQGGAYWNTKTSIRVLNELTYGDVMDGLELACASTEANYGPGTSPGVGGVSNDPCSPERLAGLEASGQKDLAQFEDYLRCSADLIETNAERLVVRNVPSEVVESVESEFGSATLPVLEGQRGIFAGQMTADMIALRTYRLQLANVLREFSGETNVLRNALQRIGIQREQLKVNLSREISNQVTACIAAASPSISVGVPPGGSHNPGAALATCANTAIQIGLAVKQLQLSLRSSALDESDAFITFSTAFQGHQRTLGEIEVQLVAAGHRLQSGTAQLEAIRQEGLRALGQAMLFSSDASGRQLRVNTLVRRRFLTTQARYERAKEHAIRMSYLAKLALEQRLGVRLSDLRDELTLVEAPASWEASVCTMSGLDFSRIRDGNDPDFENYSDQYIGDYVDRLHRTAESYRLDFPFHEGSDTAVVSMRDVLLDVRDSCDEGVEVPNLLANSADLSRSSWALEGCPEVLVGQDSEGVDVNQVQNCVQLDRAADRSDELGTPSAPQLGFAQPWRLRFGPPDAMGSYAISAGKDTRLTQTVAVEPGTYLLSWYGTEVTGSPLAPADAVAVWVDGAPATLSVVTEAIDGSPMCDPSMEEWCRFYSVVSVPRFAEVAISMVPNLADPGTVSGDVIVGPQTVDLGGFQFEDVSWLLRGTGLMSSEVKPTAFIATDFNARSSVPVCSDIDGDVFRSGWRYDCERLCPSGFRTDCPEEDAEFFCFWERAFQVNSEDLLGQSRLVATGFAVGNYNYRVDRLGINVVGTNVRDCSRSNFPSECYASGFVNYSIEHLGPYIVQNHQGEEYSAPLFTGLIEYARGLSAERYLTNPLSGADQSLIEPYMRSEFRGRPMTGDYVVRIWDDGFVDFNAVEDIQILADYRYWTRFE